MKIAVVGTGYVGLVTGTCFSELGVDVVCVDVDVAKVNALRKGHCPIHELGLPELLERNISLERLSFTTDLKSAVATSDVIFICVNTPSREDDASADLTDVYHVAKDVASVMDSYKVIVIKSTVPVGTSREVGKIIGSAISSDLFDIASNPEFLSEGTSVYDFLNPERIVVGFESPKAKELLRQLYLPFSLQEVPIVYTGLETAEMIKYASNAFLATKVTFINEIADLCERTGVDVRDLSYGIGLDKRIGTEHLRPGPGFGGLCFPKDTTALVHTAKNAGSPVRIIETVVDINNRRKIYMAQRVVRACGGSIEGKVIAVLGLTFKSGTDDLRDSPSIAIIRELLKHGGRIRAHDPLGIPHAKQILKDIEYFQDIYQMVENCDALVIATAWKQFGKLDLNRIKEAVSSRVIVDMHNLYDANDMRKRGFDYIGIGQGFVSVN